MTKELNLPASYAELSDEELTYTEGGSLSDVSNAAGSAVKFLGTCATVVGVVVLGSSYIWGISQARNWLEDESNREGNWLTVAGRALDDIGTDMTQSPANFLRDAVSSLTVVTLAPISAILLLV